MNAVQQGPARRIRGTLLSTPSATFALKLRQQADVCAAAPYGTCDELVSDLKF